MKIRHLMEGAEPKLAGAPEGIQIMTPQQFVASAGDMPGEESEEGVAEGSENKLQVALKRYKEDLNYAMRSGESAQRVSQLRAKIAELESLVKQGVAEGQNMPDANGNYKFHMMAFLRNGDIKEFNVIANGDRNAKILAKKKLIEKGYTKIDSIHIQGMSPVHGPVNYEIDRSKRFRLESQGVAEGDDRGDYHATARLANQASRTAKSRQDHAKAADLHSRAATYALSAGQDQSVIHDHQMAAWEHNRASKGLKEQGVGEDHLAEIRRLSGLDEATKLPAQSREFGGDEFQDYMKRIVGTPDLDKSGNVKVDKKGNEKYVSGKTKGDRYKMPYIHRSSVIEYLGPDGQTYSEDKIKAALAQRPKKLLKQNEKMKHSNGELEQFFNVGFAALTGIALDEETNNLIIVNTCPGAGSCKVDCFAMKGGKVQFKAAWLSDGRILTYLLNDPDGFFNQLSAEIAKEEKLGDKGGYEVTIRWHDAGDFFSPEYLDMALKMAEKHPGVKFYAYTKMADAALAKKPANFIINWSEGAHTSQEKQVKAADPDLEQTKNSRIVPDEIFQDLLVKDEKKNLVKGPEGQWQVQPDKLPQLKQRLASKYGLSANSILSYSEYMAKRNNIPQGMKYNVIVAPGEGDISANDPGVLGTLLLKH